MNMELAYRDDVGDKEESIETIDSLLVDVLSDDIFSGDEGSSMKESSIDTSLIVESIAMMSLSVASPTDIESCRNEAITKGTFIHEGQSCRTFRMKDPPNKFGSHTDFIAIKVLSEVFPDEKDIDRLNVEYTVLKHLTGCRAARDAFAQVTHKDITGIYLDWIEGITLVEWIKTLHSSNYPPLLTINDPFAAANNPDLHSLKSVMSIARDIARALSSVHDAGVAHNNFRSEHIIINAGEDISVRFISFGSASFLKAGVDEHSIHQIQDDLASLGLIFYEMLSGNPPFFDEQGHQFGAVFDEHKHGDEPGLNDPLPRSTKEIYSTLANRTPKGFLKMILKLIGSNMTNERYQSAREVCQELESMIQDPGTFTLGGRNSMNSGQLLFSSGNLYGRDKELSAIMDVCNRIRSGGHPELILVSGYSGTGKSTLIHKFGSNIEKRGVDFTSGKFCQLQQAQPYFAIINAMNGYFSKVMQRTPEQIKQMRLSISAAIGTDIGVLVDVFPSLRQVMGNLTIDSIQVDGAGALDRFKYLFEKLIRAVASPSRPLVLFLDDLQWSDMSSLGLIRAVVANTENNYFLFVGSYRSNEVSSNPALATFLKEISTRKIPATKIEFENFGREDVSELISGATGMPNLQTQSLADVVYRKTSGNVMYVTRFLQSLHDDGFLKFSFDSETWEWDAVAIEAKSVPDGVVNILMDKLLKLPSLTQYALKLLSCIGCICDESIFQLLFVHDDENKLVESNTPANQNIISKALDIAINEGLVNKEETAYRFSHDEIQCTTYSLIPKEEQGIMHLHIGNLILKNVPGDKEEDILFTAVDQLNQGIDFMNKAMKENAARLNLRAGYKSMSFAAFLSAASYLEAGISQLSDDSWDKNYLLSLQLHTSYAEAQCCNGHFSEVSRVTEIIFKKSRTLLDKIQAYSTLIKSFSSQKRIEDAIDITSNILGELGEHIPTSLPDQLMIRTDMMKSIQKLVMMDDSEFLGLKEMDNDNKVASMKFLQFLLFFFFFSKQEYLPFVIDRMLKLTLSYGVCKESCSAIAKCSFLLSDSNGDWNVSAKLGHLALLLLERLQAQTCVSRVHLLVFSGRGWSTPLNLTVMPHYDAYQKGMSAGDTRNAMSNLYTYCTKRFLCGTKLPLVEKEVRIFSHLMVEHKQDICFHTLCPIRQAVLNLMGRSDNPLELTGEAMVQEVYLEESSKMNQNYCVSLTHILCSWLAYIFGEYESAALELSRRDNIEKNMSKKIEWYGTTIFFDSLIYLALGRETRDETLIADADENMEKIRNLAAKAPCNHRHRALLLEAEIAYSRGEIDKTMEIYDLAITQAGISGYIMEEAISNERAGEFLLMQGNSRASHYFGQAINLYRQWGAEGKADSLCRIVPF